MTKVYSGEVVKFIVRSGHPQAEDGELLLFIGDKKNTQLCLWETKRIGKAFLDGESHELFPVFVSEKEVEEALAGDGYLVEPWNDMNPKPQTPNP